MTTATFPGNGNYYAQLDAWRNGNTIYGRLTVVKTSGSGYWTNNPQAYGAWAVDQSFDGSWTYDFRNYSRKIVAEWSKAVSGPGDYVVDGWVDMDDFGRADPAGITVNVPPESPAAPSNLSVSRINDNSHGVYWKDNATPAAPYTSLQVQRRMYDGSWQNFVGIVNDGAYNTSGNNRSYGDNGTVANRIYVYRIKVSNGSGEAYSSESPWVFTTPAEPTNVQAVKQASGSIVLSWTKGPPHTEINTNIDYSINGGTTWTSLVTGLAGNVSTYTHTTPPAAANIVYRVRHTIAQSNPGNNVGIGLTSGYGQSNSVPLTAPPNPPSALSPNGETINSHATQTLKWQHNSVDSSSQSAYEIRYRIAGAGSWTTTGKVVSTSQQRTFVADAFDSGNDYEWQVRTWGAHADPSDWSSTATFVASTPPTVAITAPSSILGQALVTATWSYFDAEGTAQSAWEAELLFGGVVIESRSGSGAATSMSFTTRLSDGTSYQIRVRVRDGSGLWSVWDQQTFTTDFPSPPVPSLVASFNDENGSAMFRVSNPSGSPAVVRNDILRSLDGGQTWLTVTATSVNGIGFDPTIPLGDVVSYKVVAWTDLPSSSESIVSFLDMSDLRDGGYWSAGNIFDYVVRVRYNLGAPVSRKFRQGSAQKTLHYFAGRELPVETTGTARSRTGEISFTTFSKDELDRVREMAYLPAPHLIRLPEGTDLYCSIGAVSEERVNNDWYKITVTLTEVHA